MKSADRLLKFSTDTEGGIARAILRALTYFSILLILPSAQHFEAFINLNSLVTCNNYLSYEFKITLSTFYIGLFQNLCKISLIFSAVGLCFTLASWLSFSCFALLVLHSLASCYSNHQFFPLGLILLVWALHGDNTRLSLDHILFRTYDKSRKSHIFSFLKFHFSLVFLFAAISKLRRSGLDWFTTDSLHNYLALQNFFHADFPQSLRFQWLNFWLLKTPYSTNAVGLLTILIELSAILMLFFKKGRLFLFCVLTLMQVGFLMGMYINFNSWSVFYYVWLVSFFSDYFKNGSTWLGSYFHRVTKA